MKSVAEEVEIMATQTEAQKRAKKAYRERNREKSTMQSAKRAGKTFIKNYSTLEELDEYEYLINERRIELKKDNV